MGVLTETAGRPGGRDDRLLAWPAVRDITGLSRTTAWRMQKTGDFPLPVVVSPGRVCWWESELAAWKIARAPRRPAEMRPFGSAAGRPAAGGVAAEKGRTLEADVQQPTADARDGTREDAPVSESAPQRRSGRPSARTAPGQIAFDFGP